MASGQRQEIHQAPRLRAGRRERFPLGERFHLSGPRHWPAAIDLLRCSDRERRTRPAPSGLVVAGNLRACRLPNTPISASEAAGIPRGPEGLEEPPLDSATMTRQERVVAPHHHLTRPSAPFIPSSSERWDSGSLTIPIVAETDHFARPSANDGVDG